MKKKNFRPKFGVWELIKVRVVVISMSPPEEGYTLKQNRQLIRPEEKSNTRWEPLQVSMPLLCQELRRSTRRRRPKVGRAAR
jgi:hypothetical protein